MTPEEKAREQIEAQLTASGWAVQTTNKGNDFCKKITCKTTGDSPKALIKRGGSEAQMGNRAFI